MRPACDITLRIEVQELRSQRLNSAGVITSDVYVREIFIWERADRCEGSVRTGITRSPNGCLNNREVIDTTDIDRWV